MGNRGSDIYREYILKKFIVLYVYLFNFYNKVEWIIIILLFFDLGKIKRLVSLR